MMTDDDKQELSDMLGDVTQALHNDLDQGVPFLTRKAIEKFAKNHPEFTMAMSRLGEKIEEVCGESKDN